MKKLYIENKLDYIILMTLIGSIIIYNIMNYSEDIIGILPIIIQSTIFVLLMSKNRFSKIATKIWSLVFLIGGAGLQVIGIFLQYLGGNADKIYSNKLITALLLLVLGIIVFELANRVGKIQ